MILTRYEKRVKIVNLDLYFQLNAEIAKLQGMQHKYSLLEFESTKSMWLHQSGDEVPEIHFTQMGLYL